MIWTSPYILCHNIFFLLKRILKITPNTGYISPLQRF